MRQIHPLSFRRPCGAMGKSKKCDFCFFRNPNKRDSRSRKSRRTRRLRFAVILRRKQRSGICPRRCFLLLWRIFRASPIKECAKFILFPLAVHTAQWEKAKSVIFAFSRVFCSRKFFRADERIFRDLRTTPRARGNAAGRGDTRGAPFQGTPFCMRAPSPFLHEPYGKWGARAQKRGFACAES